MITILFCTFIGVIVADILQDQRSNVLSDRLITTGLGAFSGFIVGLVLVAISTMIGAI